MSACRRSSILPPANKPERKLYGTLFRLGDKVMQTQNNYDKDVYNGDIGFIRSMDMIEQTLTVDFDGRVVTYDWSEADQLALAYVVSVHKAQGSEFPVVVMPVVTQHYTMLQRNLLYTAITRASKLCVLTGSRRAISMAVHNNKVAQRFTALEWRLRRNEKFPGLIFEGSLFSYSPYADTLRGGLRPPHSIGKSQGHRPCESGRVRKVS